MTNAYTVTQAPKILEEFAKLAQRAAEQGRLQLFIAASRWLLSELHRTPQEMGESGTIWPTANLNGRRVFVGPLYTEYAIHEPSRTVFIRRVILLRTRRSI